MAPDENKKPFQPESLLESGLEPDEKPTASPFVQGDSFTGPASAPVAEPPSTPKKSSHHRLLWLILFLIVLAGCTAGAYVYGNNRGINGQKNATSSMVMKAANTPLKVPTGATIVSQCTAGEGTQYILPKNIPTGPIYNVWDNKVVGIEFMIGQNSLLTLNQDYYNLSLANGTFDHLDIVYEPVGHAGFTEAHDHFILSTISYAAEKKITCNGQSSGMSISM